MSEFVIVGAGAIGSILGVALAEAGHGVRFIEADRDHVAAVRRSGLRLSGHRDARIDPPIMTPDELAGPVRQVLLAVKSRHTLEALQPLVPHLAADGFVVSLQNGLEEYRIAECVGAQRTIGAFLTFGGHYREPGHIVFGGPGTFRIGEMDGAETTRLRDLQLAFSALQPVETTANIFGFLWSKIALGAIYFATAATDEDVTALYDVPRYRALFGRLAGEVVAVADARGVTTEIFDGFDPSVFRPGGAPDDAAIAAVWDGQRRYWNRHEGKRTGIWRDLAVHKRKTEVDRLVGAVIEFADGNGIAVPGTRALVDLIRDIEEGRRAQTTDNLDDLLSQLD